MRGWIGWVAAVRCGFSGCDNKRLECSHSKTVDCEYVVGNMDKIGGDKVGDASAAQRLVVKGWKIKLGFDARIWESNQGEMGVPVGFDEKDGS